MVKKSILSTILLSSLSYVTAEVSGSSEDAYVQRPVALPDLEVQEHNEEFVEAYNSSDGTQTSVNQTCPSNVTEDSDSPISQLLNINSRGERLEYIEKHGIDVDHTFLNEASERFLYIQNFHSTSEFLAGEVGAAEAFNAQNLNYNKENSFLKLKVRDCPIESEEVGPCYTIENGNGQLYALKFKDNPYMFAFDKAYNDALMEGMVVFDSTRFERVYSSGLWVLEDSETIDGSESSNVLIRNVGTGRRLFAKHGHDKKNQFGGSPGMDDDQINDDHKWRHCARYAHGQERRIDCSKYV